MSEHVSTRSRRTAALAVTAAVGLVPVGLVAVRPPAAATPETSVAAVLATPSYTASWIAIRTGASAGVGLYTASGATGATQTLASASNCTMNQGSAAGRYVTFSGTTTSTFTESLASFASGSIGVKEKKSGVSCYQVNSPAEKLRMTLGAGLAATLGYEAVASSAYLDVELKQNAQILATLTRGSQTHYFALYSGSTVSNPVPDGLSPGQLPASHKTVCSNSADSGADSGVNDNCRWPISAPSWTGPDDGILFDTMTLTALNGSFSLEGGSDGSVLPEAPLSTPDASIIEVVDGVLDCGASTRTIAAAGDSPQVTVTRLDNADGSTCVAVPYHLGADPFAAQFVKPLDSQTAAQFVWDVGWSETPAPGTTALGDVVIDYEYPAPGQESVTLGWCPADGYALSGAFVGYSGFPPSADQEPDLPGTQFACVVSRQAQPVRGSSRISVQDRVYVYGDAKLSYN